MTFLKIACLHVSFTAYENFYRLSKNALSSHLLSTFSPSEVSEIRNSTIKHISTYTLVHSYISTYMGDHAFLYYKGLGECESTHFPTKSQSDCLSVCPEQILVSTSFLLNLILGKFLASFLVNFTLIPD